MPIQIACPHCRKPLQIPAGAESTTIQCPHCQGLSRVPGKGSSPAADVRPDFPKPPSDPAMNPWAGITAMVVGIVGVVLACLPMCAAPLGLVAMILGWIGLSHYKAGRGMATAGLVLGACGILISLGMLIATLALSQFPASSR